MNRLVEQVSDWRWINLRPLYRMAKWTVGTLFYMTWIPFVALSCIAWIMWLFGVHTAGWREVISLLATSSMADWTAFGQVVWTMGLVVSAITLLVRVYRTRLHRQLGYKWAAWRWRRGKPSLIGPVSNSLEPALWVGMITAVLLMLMIMLFVLSSAPAVPSGPRVLPPSLPPMARATDGAMIYTRGGRILSGQAYVTHEKGGYYVRFTTPTHAETAYRHPVPRSGA